MSKDKIGTEMKNMYSDREKYDISREQRSDKIRLANNFV